MDNELIKYENQTVQSVTKTSKKYSENSSVMYNIHHFHPTNGLTRWNDIKHLNKSK